MSADPPATAAVRRFVDAFNAEDLDALLATLTEDIEVQSSRGLIEGREEVRRWATRTPSGDLHQRLVIDDLTEHGAHVVASVRRQWTWPDGEIADEQALFCVATLRDGLICRWQPFDGRAEALRAAGCNADNL